jgi:hypothetical protein
MREQQIEIIYEGGKQGYVWPNGSFTLTTIISRRGDKFNRDKNTQSFRK